VQQRCSKTKGFCCAKGVVSAETKGSCGRKKGKFSLKKSVITSLCSKEKGFCCKDGKISLSTQGSCKSQHGSFFFTRKEATRNCAKQSGYCCVAGKIIRMNQGTCEQRKEGRVFFSRVEAGKNCTVERVLRSKVYEKEMRNKRLSGGKEDSGANRKSNKTIKQFSMKPGIDLK